MKHYLEQLDAAHEQDEVVIDASAVQAALEKLKRDPEPHLMRMGNGFAPLTSEESSGVLSRRMPETAVSGTCCRSDQLTPEPASRFAPGLSLPGIRLPVPVRPMKLNPPSMEMFGGGA
jgi:hypothetical protein